MGVVIPKYSDDALARKQKYNRERARTRRAQMSDEDRELYRKTHRQYEADNRDRVNELWRKRYPVEEGRGLEKPFIAWDGEGRRSFAIDSSGECEELHHYMLFGCSRYPDNPVIGRDLGTKECLDYIMHVEEGNPDAIHVSFSFGYDVSMILKDLSRSQLKHLSVYGYTSWHNYKINHIPDKWFRVTRLGHQRATATIFDIFGFFHSKYTSALIKYEIRDRETIREIEAGKDKRGGFTHLDTEYVWKYWQKEIELMPELMNVIRDMCYDADLMISQWHGPGALASRMISKYGVKEWKSDNVPPEVSIATQYAFAGGRFEYWQCGLWMHPVYTADLNSAYMYACTLMPRLDNGRWVRIPPKKVDRKNITRFGMYYIKFDAGYEDTHQRHKNAECDDVFPLFRRTKDKHISWPHRVEGWYWSPEAQAVADDPRAEFVSAWVYEDDGTYPFKWIHKEYAKRVKMQNEGNAAEKIIKWALAAMYGAYAQRVGWDQVNRKPPRSHELAWAGFITSWCRAEMYKLASKCMAKDPHGLISIDTDGITSTVPFKAEWIERGEGDSMGQWKIEPYAGILYWGSGFYWLMDKDGNWTTAKSRGFPKGSVSVESALQALKDAEPTLGGFKYAPKIVRWQTRFIGYREAMNSRNGMNRWRKWIKVEHRVTMGAAGMGWHAVKSCPKCRNPELDVMHTIMHIKLTTVSASPVSQPHKLPWLEEADKLPENMLIVQDMDEADK